MGWTPPMTFGVGDLLKAADLNTHLRDNLNYLLSPNVISATKNDADFTLSSTTYAVIHSTFNVPMVVHGGPILVFAKLRANITNTYLAEISLAVGTNLIKVWGTAGDIVSRPLDTMLAAIFTGIAAGTYNVSVQAKVNNAAATLTFGALANIHSMYAIEL